MIVIKFLADGFVVFRGWGWKSAVHRVEMKEGFSNCFFESNLPELPRDIKFPIRCGLVQTYKSCLRYSFYLSYRDKLVTF